MLDLLAVSLSLLALVMFLTHDPPSGHNHGTGDSWLSVLVVTLLAVICIALKLWELASV